jgi:hypothetical protein
MKTAMFTMTEDPKIAGIVVLAVAVKVVDDFIRSKIASQNLLHNEAVLVHITRTVSRRVSVAKFEDVAVPLSGATPPSWIADTLFGGGNLRPCLSGNPYEMAIGKPPRPTSRITGGNQMTTATATRDRVRRLAVRPRII